MDLLWKLLTYERRKSKEDCNRWKYLLCSWIEESIWWSEYTPQHSGFVQSLSIPVDIFQNWNNVSWICAIQKNLPGLEANLGKKSGTWRESDCCDFRNLTEATGVCQILIFKQKYDPWNQNSPKVIHATGHLIFDKRNKIYCFQSI